MPNVRQIQAVHYSTSSFVPVLSAGSGAVSTIVRLTKRGSGRGASSTREINSLRNECDAVDVLDLLGTELLGPIAAELSSILMSRPRSSRRLKVAARAPARSSEAARSATDERN